MTENEEKLSMTVEVPVHLTIEFDDPLQVDEDTDPVGMGVKDAHRMVRHKEPTDEFKRAVSNMLESETVSVNEVYAASGWTVTTDE